MPIARWMPTLLATTLATVPAGCDAGRPPTAARPADAGMTARTLEEAARPRSTRDDIRAFADGAYLGLVRVRIVPPEGSAVRPLSRSGTASGELDASGRLVVVGDIDREADAGFAADGRFVDAGWVGAGGDVELRIAADGSIRGGGIADGNRTTIEGRIDRRKLELVVEVALLAGSDGGFPAGTRYRFGYELWRPFTGAAGRTGQAGQGADRCREVVYRTKLVPNLGGGAMGMVRVPECRR